MPHYASDARNGGSQGMSAQKGLGQVCEKQHPPATLQQHESVEVLLAERGRLGVALVPDCL